MFWLTLIFIIGINFSSIVFSGFLHNTWEAQGLWTQIMTMTMFSWSFKENKKREINNWPLGLFIFWSGMSTILYFYFRNNLIALNGLFTFLNLLIGVILFKCFSEYLEKKDFEFILDRVLSWILLMWGFICVLQYFGYGQFFYIYYPNSRYFSNPVVGLIGNPTLLSNFIGMLVPVLFYKPNLRKYLTLLLICIILVWFTGETDQITQIRDPSISGMMVAIFSSLYYLFHKSIKFCSIVFGMISLVSLALFYILPHDFLSTFLSPHGRSLVWQYYIGLSKSYAIWGSGLGFVKSIYTQSLYPTADHLHQEFLQVFFELGWVGLIIFLVMIEKFLRIKVNESGIILKSIVMGFLVSCCFNFPAHLWLTSTYAIFAYAGTFVNIHSDKEIG